jgi:3-oxoadipate enol-lactonase
MSETERGGARIWFDATGALNQPVVLLSHSLGAQSGMWAPQIAALEGRFRVIRYDARGHGQSAVPPGAYSIAELGSDALAVLDASGIERAHVCGISMGGQVAIWLARHAPSRVLSIVLANTGARIGTDETWQQRIDLVRTSGLEAIAATIPGRWFTTAFAERNPDVIRAFQRDMIATTRAGYLGCCAALQHTDLRSELPHITARTLVIGGEFDPATTIQDAELLRDGIRGARLVRLPTAHISNVEAADDFTQAVTGFFEDSADG